MAHSPQVKANALVMLMLGDSPRYVAEQTGVPLTTVKRWRNVDMKKLLREIFGPNFNRSIRMALKKKMGS
jgi:transposase-like protein